MIKYILCIFTFFFFSACKNDVEEVQVLTRKENHPAETAVNAEIIYSEAARMRVKLNAPVLKRYTGEKPYVELPEGIKVVFYDSLKREESRLTANYAISHEAEKIMEARYNVEVINAKGEKLNTEHLIWNQEKKTIYTNEFVKITTPDEVIMGEGLEADESFTRYKIKKIKGTITINQDDKDSTDS